MILLSTLLLSGFSAFADEDAGVEGADLEIPFEKYELDNGLDVILAPDPSTPIVYTNVWYHVGSKDEQPGLTGFAHLFEHLMFQGSLSTPGEYFTPLQQVGAQVNGTTSFDRTNYYEELPSQYLPLALFMESDRMGWLLDVLDQGKLDNQRDVVRNERRQRYENPPYGEASKTLYEHVWPAGHPYHHMPIGSHADLQNASLDDVKAFFRRWYVPNNASLVVAGDFDPEVAKPLIEEHFGDIPRGDEIVRAEVPQVTLDKSTTLYQYDDVPQQKVWVAWVSPALYAPGDAELDLLSSVLSDGKDSRLYRELVKERQIAKDIRAYQSSHGLQSIYVVHATAAAGHDTDEVVAAIDEVLADVLGDSPPTQAEIAAAKNNYEVGFYRRLATIGGKGDLLNLYNYHRGDPGYVQQDLDRYLQPTPDEVVTTAREVLTQPRVTLHIRPEADNPDGVSTTEGGE